MHTDFPSPSNDCNSLSPASDPSVSNEPNGSISVESSASSSLSSSICNDSLPFNSPYNSTLESPNISEITQQISDLNIISPFQKSEANRISHELYTNLLDQLSLEIFFQVMRSNNSHSRHTQAIVVGDVTNVATVDHKTEPQNNNAINNKKLKIDNPKAKIHKSNGDIFGNSLNGINKLECVCPHCSRFMAAVRLAPHLEKCMGMGRNSSRLASKRIALVVKNSNGASSE